MYKILYTRFVGGQRHVIVFDFKGEQTIEFTLDELEKDELTEELKEYISGIREQIDSGYFDYDL
ncbi:hypothetical protein M670_00119 [Schinkia azotoformans MEV2011]|uniref:Uncharacterized protein n=1 Tax=Schinkia azotoformans MEV2011 TaxID=1348973 RepID=A0A072NR31_SCHAZ|nr:hypothetical protein [Schinkia azotoformans]KEF40104.1 hypothetical protein M670_00119 [Schinkia azotoformans MEV2011]